MRKQDSGFRIQDSDDTPIGLMIIMLMPMVWAFWALIEAGL